MNKLLTPLVILYVAVFHPLKFARAVRMAWQTTLRDIAKAETIEEPQEPSQQ